MYFKGKLKAWLPTGNTLVYKPMDSIWPKVHILSKEASSWQCNIKGRTLERETIRTLRLGLNTYNIFNLLIQFVFSVKHEGKSMVINHSNQQTKNNIQKKVIRRTDNSVAWKIMQKSQLKKVLMDKALIDWVLRLIF